MERTRFVRPTILSALRLTAAIAIVFASFLRTRADDLAQWLNTESTVSTSKVLNNILGNGAVIASRANPASGVCHPDYFYHWVRDGSLVMDTVVSMYAQAPDPATRARYLGLLTQYIDFSIGLQNTNNLSSAMGRGLGEPKFNTDGTPYNCNWGRPQDDGPALRAASLCRLANLFLDDGSPQLNTLVRTKLYDSVLPTNSLIKKDLEYVSHNWGSPCIDLWEESYGNHFYTSLVQRRALRDGAALAVRLGDGGAATWYSAQATLLEAALRQHWDATHGYLRGTLNGSGPACGSTQYKTSGLDVAVVLGVLHAHAQGDPFYSPTDDQVLATVQALVTTFGQNGFYPINGTQHDSQGGLLGTAIGRYPEDRYDPTQVGIPCETQKGNPWFLCTAAIGELYYRAANDWDTQGSLAVTSANKSFLAWLDSTKFASLQPGHTLARGDQAFADVLAALRTAGDAQLRRVKYHTAADGSLSEQFNRNTGFETSYGDLSWSYASLLTAAAQRPPGGSLGASRNTHALTDRDRTRVRALVELGAAEGSVRPFFGLSYFSGSVVRSAIESSRHANDAAWESGEEIRRAMILLLIAVELSTFENPVIRRTGEPGPLGDRQEPHDFIVGMLSTQDGGAR